MTKPGNIRGRERLIVMLQNLVHIGHWTPETGVRLGSPSETRRAMNRLVEYRLAVVEDGVYRPCVAEIMTNETVPGYIKELV